MSHLEEQISEQFHRWESRGRGWQVHPFPVVLEPPFQPFTGYSLTQAIDDTRKPTILSGLGDWLSNLGKAPDEGDSEETEPEPVIHERGELVELQLSLPEDFKDKPEAIVPFLMQLGLCHQPIAFEIFGTGDRTTIQFAVEKEDVPTLRRQLNSHFPDVAVTECQDALSSAWDINEAETLIVEFGLGQAFGFPLALPDADPFVGMVGALDDLIADEAALFQIFFQPVKAPWTEHLLQAVIDFYGYPLFENALELPQLVQEKTSSPLFAAVVRIAVRAKDFDRVIEIARDMAASLRVFSRADGNELIPLSNAEYPFDSHVEDLLNRQSRRTGMLLNIEELIGLVHLPTTEVQSYKLQRDLVRSKVAPRASKAKKGLLLGHNSHAGRLSEVRLSPEDRSRHMHVIGASGTGKSTFLFNLIRQDIENGGGVALLDPHGDLVDRLLGIIPTERIDDVVLIDPSDEDFPVGFNILSAHSSLEKNLLASDLVSVFERLSTSWGDQMGSVLQNAILAFLESSQGGTLLDLRRFLLEPAFRSEFLETVSDPDILYYWRKGFAQLTGNKSIGPVLTRLEAFLAPKPIRYMVSQPVNRLDFADILDTGKIFLAKLPQGLIGRENSFLLGSLMVSKFQQLAMARQAKAVASRRDFYLYIDECPSFITPSMAEILSGARKYRLGLILAHQEMRQLERDREVAGAVLSNCHTRVVFRVGDADARSLEHGFASFDRRDLQNLETGQAICRIEKASNDFNLRVVLPEDRSNSESNAEAVIASSRKRYGTPRAEVEAALRLKLNITPEPPKAKRGATPKPAEETPIPQPIILPLPTVSEKEPLKVSPPAPEPAKPHEFGRGGAGHQSIQKRIRILAEELGYLATIEKCVLSGQGSIDVALERDGSSIACEVAITTPIAHEVENVQKCLKAGFSHVAAIATTSERLAAIQKAVEAIVSAEEAVLIGYYTPDAFEAHLRKVGSLEKTPCPPSLPDAPKGKTIKGFKVRFHAPPLSDTERQSREALAVLQMQEVMKAKPPSLPRKKKDGANHPE